MLNDPQFDEYVLTDAQFEALRPFAPGSSFDDA